MSVLSIGRVRVNSPIRTTITDPNFKPKLDVAFVELTDVEPPTSPQEGDVVVYDAVQGKYTVAPIDTAHVSVALSLIHI